MGTEEEPFTVAYNTVPSLTPSASVAVMVRVFSPATRKLLRIVKSVVFQYPFAARLSTVCPFIASVPASSMAQEPVMLTVDTLKALKKRWSDRCTCRWAAPGHRRAGQANC